MIKSRTGGLQCPLGKAGGQKFKVQSRREREKAGSKNLRRRAEGEEKMGRFLSSVRALRSFGVRKSPSRSKPIENLRAANIRFPIVRKKKKDGGTARAEGKGRGKFSNLFVEKFG